LGRMENIRFNTILIANSREMSSYHPRPPGEEAAASGNV
jgi:hypothetical protein